MRLSMIAAAGLSLAFATCARAEASLDHSCIAVGDGYQHVAATVSKPEDCCTGRMQCSQFLSTTTVVRPAHEQHT